MKNKTVIRKKLEKGNYTTIQYSILKDIRLSANGFRLLVNILADSDDNFDLSPTVYCKRLNITKVTFFYFIKNLVECGYVKKDISKINSSKNHYILSEFGNLKQHQGETIESNSDTTIKLKDAKEPVIQAQVRTKEFDDYLKSILDLADYKDFEILLMDKWIGELNISTKIELKTKVDEYLVSIYNEYLGLAKNPEKNTKALIAYKKWLKVEIFDNHKLELNAQNKWAILSLVTNKKANKTDYETEMGDYYENPRD